MVCDISPAQAMLPVYGIAIISVYLGKELALSIFPMRALQRAFRKKREAPAYLASISE